MDSGMCVHPVKAVVRAAVHPEDPAMTSRQRIGTPLCACGSGLPDFGAGFDRLADIGSIAETLLDRP
jgi:hypothetical protein